MPLDPFFSERLRVHRRYLIRRRIDAFRARVAGLRAFRWGGENAAMTRTSTDSAAGRIQRARSDVGSARARHRRAAMAWDHTELETVGTPGPDVRTAEHEVTVCGHPSVRVRIYYPDATGARPVPVWLTFFGGAFRIGGIDYPTTDAANRRRAAEAGVAMAAVDYALAPEHRFPTQIEQAYAALVWLHQNAEELGIDRDRIGVAGTSAGASIAAALTLANRDRAGLPIRLQLLEAPVTDLTGDHLDGCVQ